MKTAGSEKSISAATDTGNGGDAGDINRQNSAGRVLHTGQVIIDLVMRVPRLPERGAETIATDSLVAVGGGFNVLAAAARDGAAVCYLGAVGDGEYGKRVLRELRFEGITVLQQPVAGKDTGYCVALVEPDGERSFLTVLGAESVPTRLPRIAQPGDVIYVSGYCLLSSQLAAQCLDFLRDSAAAVPGISVVLDPAPVVSEVDPTLLQQILRHATVLTLNEREARVLSQAAGLFPDASGLGSAESLARRSAAAVIPDSAANIASRLAQHYGCDVVLRLGERGCVVVTGQNHKNRSEKPTGQTGQDAEQSVVAIPAPQVYAIDTNGAGDAHTGVLCGQLAGGSALTVAAARANIAAALAVTRTGPATAPTTAEINAAKW